jgi:hypothetical protein
MPYDNKGQYYALPREILLPLGDFRIVSSAGAVGAIAAVGGLPASDSAGPTLGATAQEAQSISWAASNNGIISIQKTLPNDFDGTNDVTIEMWVNSGTTDAATFTAETSWDDGALVSTTVTDGAKSATTHKITAVIPATSIPDTASFVTLELTPAAHTTNAIKLMTARLSYPPRTLAV